MGKNYRPGRLGEEIKKIASEVIQRDLKDPRLSQAMISISDVDVTDDAGVAILYVSVLPLNGQMEGKEADAVSGEVLQALEGAKGLVRTAVSKRAGIRHIPELFFRLDKSFAYGQHMDSVIDKAMEGIKSK